jgi:hypothetical protein
MPEPIKGMSEYSRRFLEKAEDEGTSDIKISEGDAALSKKRQEEFSRIQAAEFIKKSGAFTEDLVAFIVDQKEKRGLEDRMVVFSLALANINLRHSYCAPQNASEQKAHNPERNKELAKEWDEICWSAQCYFNENT